MSTILDPEEVVRSAWAWLEAYKEAGAITDPAIPLAAHIIRQLLAVMGEE